MNVYILFNYPYMAMVYCLTHIWNVLYMSGSMKFLPESGSISCAEVVCVELGSLPPGCA